MIIVRTTETRKNGNISFWYPKPEDTAAVKQLCQSISDGMFSPDNMTRTLILQFKDVYQYHLYHTHPAMMALLNEKYLHNATNQIDSTISIEHNK